MYKWRIILVDQTWVEFVPPEPFNFPAWIKAVRSDGFVLADTMYIRADFIKCVLRWDDKNPPMTTAIGNAPTTETKQ